LQQIFKQLNRTVQQIKKEENGESGKEKEEKGEERVGGGKGEG
jgi:hypothetical protein